MIQRIAYLDIVKLVTIYLVILGHVLVMMKDGLIVGKRMIDFIYSFHMPLFMLLSGFFFSNKTLSMPFGTMLCTKSKQLLLPIITCTFICCLYLFLYRGNANYRDEIIGNSWFLKVLFIFYVLFWILKQTKINDWILILLSCFVLFVIPFGSTLQINLLWPFFLAGYLLKRYDVLEKIAGSWLTMALCVSLYVGSYSLQQHWDIPNYIPINIDTLPNKLLLILLRYVVAFCGCMSVILIIALVNRYIGNIDLFCRLAKYGRYTLGIYVLQTILVINIFPDTLAWYVESEWLLNAVIAPALSIGFLVLCLWLIQVISKNKTLDLLFFGGQYYKN